MIRNLKTAEIPVRWINSPNRRVILVADSARMLKDLFKIHLNAIIREMQIELWRGRLACMAS
jgi:hypothetical protein